jgi:hypothetical protein
MNRHSASTSSRTALLLGLCALLAAPAALSPATALAEPPRPGGVLQRLGRKVFRHKHKTRARARARVIRRGISAHRHLVHKGPAIKLPKSNVLSSKRAAAKKYADSWTCRASSRLLIRQLKGQRAGLVLDSSGKKTFKWGKEGWVSYHYYAVDDPARPTVLLDPTAVSNFRRDAQPGGMMASLLQKAGEKLKQPKAANRVTRRLARGGIDGMLVLANPGDIAVYREALEQAASLRRGKMTRDEARE